MVDGGGRGAELWEACAEGVGCGAELQRERRHLEGQWPGHVELHARHGVHARPRHLGHPDLLHRWRPRAQAGERRCEVEAALVRTTGPALQRADNPAHLARGLGGEESCHGDAPAELHAEHGARAALHLQLQAPAPLSLATRGLLLPFTSSAAAVSAVAAVLPITAHRRAFHRPRVRIPARGVAWLRGAREQHRRRRVGAVQRVRRVECPGKPAQGPEELVHIHELNAHHK
mmetsp:Transcript_3694/g.10925  ORF Transcript_3694/g.10925 Transcript_3694/m.10925 type:complete len:231 (-) Transcript_3694:1391-2083(-)